MTKAPARLLLVLLALACGANYAAAANPVESVIMPGKVIQGHAKFEGECGKCHELLNKPAQDRLCSECHKQVGADISTKKGYHGRTQQRPCRECHTEHKGREAKVVVLNEAQFDHRKTEYLLRGRHADEKVRCSACHIPGKKYREAPSQCVECHMKDDVHRGTLGRACADCHVEKGWKEVEFDHDATKFPLLGKHLKVECKACHKSQEFRDTPRQCVSCHRKDDKHKGSLGIKCENCHNERSWITGRFDHDRDTKFALKGKHANVKCASCHNGLVFKDKLPSTCIGCHRNDDYHKNRYGERCETCHAEKSWKELIFEHNRDTKFQLLGKHIKVKCDDCHKGLLYEDKVGDTCVSCHRKQDKHEGRFGDMCATCHEEGNWKTLKFVHDRDTKFLLKGKHAQVKCDTCHKGPLYTEKLKTVCFACHEKDDKHRGQEGKDCERCHGENSWKGVQFDHSKARFPLLGQHQAVQCGKCHLSLMFKDASSECVACHSTDDVHKRTLGTKCETCHNARDWRIWDFNHNKQTQFPLDGAHKRKKVTCGSCHQSATPRAPKIDASCKSCHQREDVHEGSFGPRCERCHSTANWKQLLPGFKN